MTTLTPDNAAAVVKRYGGIVATDIAATKEDRGVGLGLYGPGGAGKTTISATITDSELGGPALYLDARGNPHVVGTRYAGRIQVLPITKFAEVERVRADIAKDRDFPFKSVILDNVSEMFYMDLRDRYGPAAEIDWTKHSATTADVMQLVRNWMDLTTTGPKINVVFVFQEVPEARTIRSQAIPSRSEIAFNKALQSQVPTLINFLGRVYQYEDVPPYRRMLDFRPVETVHQAKMQVDPEDEFARQIPFEIYNPSLAPIIDTLRGRQPWPVEAHTRRAKAVTNA